jgi:hypothetical protein
MKICKGCLREYDDKISVQKNPVHELGELFVQSTDPEGENDLCPACTRETGIFNLLGFGQ